MSEKKKKGIPEISEAAVKIILFVLLIFNALVFLYFGMICRSDVLDSESLRYIESWTVKDSKGNEFRVGRSYVDPEGEEKDYEIHAVLPEGIKDNEYLFFPTRKDIAVYVGGELRKDFVEQRDVNIPGGSVKKFYMSVPLSAKDSGAEVKMVRTSEVKDDEVVPETFISTRFEAFRYLQRREGLSFFLSCVVMVLSLVVCIVSVVLRFWYKLKIDMMYGALGIFITAAWVMTDSFLFPFIFGVYHVNGVLNYMFCLMIPFALALYLNSVQNGRYRRSLTVVLIVSGINAVLWPLLHFTGILPFYNIRTVANLILALVAVIAIVVLIIDAGRKNIGEYRYTFIGFLGFLVCCIAELLIILLVSSSDATLPMVAGLAFLLVFIVIQQIDDLRKVNAERQHAIEISEAKTRFLASMSHEIRTPINSILGMNEMVLRENRDKVIDEYSRSIKSSGKMLLMLVNDVLDFSRIEAGKLEINEDGFLMSEMLYDVVSMVKERADEKELEFRTELKDELPNAVISDEFRIRQILINLINNAIKYTERGTVTLTLGGCYQEDGYELYLAVRDTGKGIRKDDQPHLFEAFSRADLKANANIEGTGLGLAIVKSIVDSMKGSLGVESEYGVGSEFWVRLPVKYESREPLSEDFMQRRIVTETVQEESSFTAPSARILAVDDNQSNLTVVRLFLKRIGIRPDLCSSGKRAIELCREKKYDLLLLDHMMPQPDGIETLQIIRKDKDSLNRDTRAVVLTANAISGSRQMYLDAGFEDYLTKPLDSLVLEQTVKHMLPAEKVIEAPQLTDPAEEEAGEMMEFLPEKPAEPWSDDIMDFRPEAPEGSGTVQMSPIRRRLSAIEGLDYDTALRFCGGDETFLASIVADTVSEADERAERMRKNLAEGDIKAYGIDAHTIKSNMATLGLKELSERAKKHEFAAKENNREFISGDADGFIEKYVEVCEQMKE